MQDPATGACVTVKEDTTDTDAGTADAEITAGTAGIRKTEETPTDAEKAADRAAAQREAKRKFISELSSATATPQSPKKTKTKID